MKFSSQAIGAVMMALQNSLLNQTDIVPTFEEWNLYLQDGELYVENPPSVEIDNEDEEEEQEELLDFLTNPEVEVVEEL